MSARPHHRRRWIAVGVALCALLAAGLWLAWARGGAAKLRELIVARAETHLELRAEIQGPIRVAWALRPGLDLSDVRLRSLPDADLELDIGLERVGVRFDLSRLLRGDLVPDRLILRNGRVRLDPADHGRAGSPSEGGFVAELPHGVEVRGVALELGSAGEPVELAWLEDAFLGGCDSSARLDGRLLGVPLDARAGVDCSGGRLHLRPFELAAGASELTGEVELGGDGRSLQITARLESSQLDASDLLPPQSADRATAWQSADRPTAWLDRALPFDQLSDTRLDLALSARRLTWSDHAPVGQAELELALDAGQLAASLRGAALDGSVDVGLVARGDTRPPSLGMRAELRDLAVGKLAPGSGARGRLRASVDLAGHGATPRQLLATTGGTLALSVAGDLPRGALGALGRDVRSILSSLLKTEQVRGLRCGVLRAEFLDGMGAPTVLILDSPDATIGGGGRIDLRELTAQLELRPVPKRASIGAIKTPIRIDGPLTHLRAGIDKSEVAKDTGVLLALGLLNPFLFAVPLVDMGSGDENPCETALASATAELPKRGGILREANERVWNVGRRLTRRR